MNTTSILDGFTGVGQQGNPTTVPARGKTHRPLVQGSVAAQALHRVVRGARVLVIDSPPGGGKTTLLVDVLAHLANRFGDDYQVTLAAPVREQAANVYTRLAEHVDPRQMKWAITSQPAPDVPACEPGLSPAGGAVEFRTLASLRREGAQTLTGEKRRLLVVEEAYQATYADVAASAANYDQILMVGDPGQIGPVVGINTGAWERLRRGPHRRAPEAFVTMGITERLSIDTSFRLGPDTVRAIRPLYGFDFASGRHPMHLALDGQSVPELDALCVPGLDHSLDPRFLRAAADRVSELTRATHTGPDGQAQPLRQDQIAVVAALNTQVSIVEGMLAGDGLGQVKVGTADKLQGGQWTAVVALDPLAGGTASEHHLSTGRACVMASRHTTHLTWVHDDNWRAALAEQEGPQVTKAVRLRKALIGR